MLECDMFELLCVQSPHPVPVPLPVVLALCIILWHLIMVKFLFGKLTPQYGFVG